MIQKFSGDVGQVAGGDVKSNSAQTNVNVHFHGSGPKPIVTQFISDRQRNAIARKAFEIQAKTGTDKLMVYRRLMTVFEFERMDEMPRNVYERAIKYLDGWIRNGTLGQTPGAPASKEVKEPAPAVPQPVAPSDPVPPVVATTPAEPAPPVVPAQPQKKRSPWFAVSIGVTAAMAIAVMYVVVPHSDASAQTQAAELPRHCEYGGNRYSPGGVVMQAGIRQQCVTDGERGARWERAPGGRH
ncbi:MULTISPECIES: alpha/beta hydrolase [unclassified Burkholderia]|uniref:alpha/beta hydrolase n=1 Tax=unclassified Burkholderia TaxID=2613784 RepID=UPI00158DCB73|nr:MULTISPECIES: alpha/beta hydrolase [unclassified Burkholderia]